MSKSAFDTHMNEPRNVGYSSENAYLYQGTGEESLLKAKNSIFNFKGVMQIDPFLLAFALGVTYGDRNPISKKENNISVGAMSDKQKWMILATQILATNDIDFLSDEREAYQIAEEYANAGIKILKSKMSQAGDNFPEELEIELKRKLGVLK